MLSFAESLQLDCPRCSTPFQAETWVTVDSQERPDLVARILDGSLHTVNCPTCGRTGVIPAPLLYHNGQAGRVLLAVPLGMDEEQWREAGQTLLWSLIGALPEDQRLPYLGELQAELGLEGIAQVIIAEQLADEPTTVAGSVDEAPPIVPAVEAILQARTPAELQQALRTHPILTSPQAVTILRELAHAAFQQDEEEAGSGFSRAADLVLELQALAQIPAEPVPVTVPPIPEHTVDDLAFALLRTHTGAELAALVDEYPELLNDASDGLLAQWAQVARATNKDRIADEIDERRRALTDMRIEYQRQRPVLEAVQALLDADTPEAIEAAIIDYDELLTSTADDILARLAADATPEISAMIAERRRLLQQVRVLLEAQAPETQADN